ncbi:hypothetical protein [Leeuwenhoekiella marinoflava]|uniref:Uncharacterized protein n=2 Tax=Leeuwenhoekiella marinoflava TaxID=988 RepID=A0A4Q0PR25_9FLAO|nr:hypothetical protein [Leeuwenhoekiella marinoflava]RXG33007.1 hypothetical protein DSL99_100 [Leeuwenhoekiella marinoflava]SHE35267.1 hypothetical protein SAMN02745246_00160 [Leeuwenhoekiella marinoflava DSM 3653]
MDLIKFRMLDKEAFDFRTETKKTIKLTSRFDYETGEILEFPKNGKYYNMEANITKNASYLKGSLQKFGNLYQGLGNQNYNDFSFCDCKEYLQILCDDLYIIPDKTKITNLEFGLNIEVPYDPKILIEDALLMFDFKDHNIREGFNGKGNYKEFKKSDYSIKVYNKSKQYKQSTHILRIELKIIRARILERNNIFSLADLSREETHETLFELLLASFEKLMIIDVDKLNKALKTDEINHLKNFTNPNYWNQLQKDLKPNQFYKAKRMCNAHIEKYNSSRMKEFIKKALQAKFKELMNCYSLSYSKAA